MNPSLHEHASNEDENELGSLLSRFKPLPSDRFTNRMLSAPWRMNSTAPVSNTLARKIYSPRLVWAICLLLFTLLVVASLAIPQVRAIARQIIYSFIPAPSNQIEVQITPSNPGTLFNFSDPSNFPLSLEEANLLAGFNIKQILPLPEQLGLIGARYDSDNRSVILLYLGDNFELFLTQRLIESGEDVFSIGPEASVQLIKIGNRTGEYVEGGWKAVSIQPTDDHQSTEKPINITAVWDDSLPQSTIRWKVEKMTYELRALGENRPSQSELINWANELK